MLPDAMRLLERGIYFVGTQVLKLKNDLAFAEGAFEDLPPCNMDWDGARARTPGGPGVADTYWRCTKSALDAYAWREVDAATVVVTPGGSDGDIQYNNGGSLGGFGEFNDSTSAVTLPGSLTITGATDAATIDADALTDTRAFAFPDASGTLVLTDTDEIAIESTVGDVEITGADNVEITATGGSLTLTAGTIDLAGNIVLSDENIQFYDDGDPTKTFEFEASGISGGNNRILTVPDASGTLALTSHTHTQQFAANVTIGDGTNVIPTGIWCDIRLPNVATTITRVSLLATKPGGNVDLVVDLWRDSFANYPPTDADSITSATPPTLSGDDESEDTTLASWLTSNAALDIIRVNVDSAATVTLATLSIHLTATVS